MKPHIAQTIEDIELKIGFLQRLADALRNFDSVTNVGTPAIPTALLPPATNGHTAKAPELAVNTVSKRRGRPPRLAKTPSATPPPNREPVGKRINSVHASARDRIASCSAMSPRMIEAGRKVAEPFDADTLSTAAGKVSMKAAANAITRWLSKEWIKRVAPGQYERTKSFGGDVTPTALQDLHKQIRGEVEAAAKGGDE